MHIHERLQFKISTISTLSFGFSIVSNSPERGIGLYYLVHGFDPDSSPMGIGKGGPDLLNEC
jgi:hypothetical protein